MSASTILRFLIGGRNSILCIAGSPGAVWVGLLFVLSAGLPREYDGEDLLREPWHLALPLAASLVTSTMLYCLVVLIVWRRSGELSRWLSGFASFLALYWMTAPLAWLYAIPYERFLSSSAAVQANLTTLAIVAAWRVLLMSRIVSVVFQCRFIAALMIVMLFADAVALALLQITPLPIVSIMGGVRLTASEQILQNTAYMIKLVGYLTFPIWLIGTAAVIGWPAKKSNSWNSIDPQRAAQKNAIRRSAWIAGAFSILAGIALLPLAQSEQQLRHKVESALLGGSVAEGLSLMSRHQRDDFPPHWDPPPRIGYGQKEPDLLDVLELLHEVDARLWVRTAFVEKITFQRHSHLINPFAMDDTQLQQFLNTLHKLPEGPTVAAMQYDAIQWELDRINEDASASTQRKQLLQALIDLADSTQKNEP